MRIECLFRGAPSDAAEKCVEDSVLASPRQEVVAPCVNTFLTLFAANRFGFAIFHVCSFHGLCSGLRWRGQQDGMCLDVRGWNDSGPQPCWAIESFARWRGISHT